MSKNKKATFYVRFYKTGEFRKVEGFTEDEAYKIAVSKFGESTGKWTIGKLLKVGDAIPQTGILLKRP